MLVLKSSLFFYTKAVGPCVHQNDCNKPSNHQGAHMSYLFVLTMSFSFKYLTSTK